MGGGGGMRRSLQFGAVAILCAAFGCGKDTGKEPEKIVPRDYETMYREEWKVYEDVAMAMESVKDKISAKAAAARIHAACDRLEEMYKEGRSRKGPQLSLEEIKKIHDKYRDED